MSESSIELQKRIWPQVLNKENGGSLYSYGWGDPLSEEAKNVPGHVLGNYKKILDQYISENINKSSFFIELGSFDGKWTQHIIHLTNHLVCADISEGPLEYLAGKYPGLTTMCVNGRNLSEFHDSSIDFIFSIDTLVRTEKYIISGYIHEFKRVLSPSGKACIHLPCQSQKLSHELGFTQLSKAEIMQYCTAAEIASYRIDEETINHGVLLLINI